MKQTLKSFGSVEFDTAAKTMKILDGTQGTYDYRTIQRATVLNEKAKSRGGPLAPFTQNLPHGPGISSILTDPYVYVGIKIVLKDGSILGIYTSKEKTQIGTDSYLKDREAALEIEGFLKKIIHKYQAEE